MGKLLPTLKKSVAQLPIRLPTNTQYRKLFL